jgi:hypothetical protein
MMSTSQTSGEKMVSGSSTAPVRYKPTVVVVDFETALLDGTASVEAYRDDFRVTACAFAWRGADGELKQKCTWGEQETEDMLNALARDKIPLVAHNLPFERMVTQCRFPGKESLFKIDTMRLAQMRDNGGKDELEHEVSFEDELLEAEGKKPIDGYSLEACTSRFLKGQDYRHKQPFIDLMVERGGKKGDFHLLTKEELTAYNLKDAEVTLKLYEVLTESFTEDGIDWAMDHRLYLARCRFVVDAKILGVRVDCDQCRRHIDLEASNIAAIERSFRETYRPQLEAIEARKAQAYVDSYKSESGRAKARAAIEAGEVPGVRFSLASNKDKAAFFVGELGLKPTFFTPTGAPSFSAKLLWQYGEAGKMIAKLGTHRIAMAQTESLMELASYDGRWHIDHKVVGARSGRLAGGSYG